MPYDRLFSIGFEPRPAGQISQRRSSLCHRPIALVGMMLVLTCTSTPVLSKQLSTGVIKADSLLDLSPSLHALTTSIRRAASDSAQQMRLVKDYYVQLRELAIDKEMLPELSKISSFLHQYYKLNATEMEAFPSAIAIHLSDPKVVSFLRHFDVGVHAARSLTPVNSSRHSSDSRVPNSLSKRPEMISLGEERKELKQLDAEMRFHKLIDRNDYLVATFQPTSTAESDPKDRFRTTRPSSIETKQDLLLQMDALKVRQQELIADRIKILEEKMKLHGLDVSPSMQNRSSEQPAAINLPIKPLDSNQTVQKLRIDKEADTLIETRSLPIKLKQSRSTLIAANTSQTNSSLVSVLASAKSFLAHGKASMALSKLNAVVLQGQQSSEFHFLMGRAYQELKLNTESLESYSLAIYLDPDNSKFWMNRGLVKGALKDSSGSLKDLSKSLTLKETPAGYLNRGVTYIVLGQTDLAMDDLNRSISLDPSYAKAYRNRGIIYNHRGDSVAACSDWRLALEKGDQEMKSWISSYCQSKES